MDRKAGNGMEKIWKYKKELLTGVSLAFLLFLFLKYIFPLLSPFILAYLTVYSVYPFLYRMEQKWKVKKPITMFLVLGIIMVILLGIVWIIALISSGSVEEAIPLILEWKDRLMQTLNIEMINKIVPEMIRNSFSYIQKVFPVFAYMGIYLIATILMAKDFDILMTKVRRIGALDVFMNVVNEIVHTAGKYLKAQVILILMIMGVCVAGFYLIGIPSAVLLGVLAGLMDALPFIGTSIVLIPTAVILFLEEEVLKGAAVLVIYIICVGIREFMEPKLMGKELDIIPVVMLISIFVGVKLFGVSGIIKGPLEIVLYKNIWTTLNKVDKPEKNDL